MQAIIMAAGKGSRLDDLTRDKPKAFLEIEGKSLIEINLHLLRAQGIKDITIVTGYFANAFESRFGRDKNIKLVYNPFYSFMNVLGSFYMGMGDLYDDFIFMHADTIFEPSILNETIHKDAQIVLPVDAKPCDSEAMKVQIENGKIRYISKNLALNDCVGEFIGLAKIRKDVVSSVKKCTTELLRQGKYSEYFEAAIQEILDKNLASAEMLLVGNRFWAEIDDKNDYLCAQQNIDPMLLHF